MARPLWKLPLLALQDRFTSPGRTRQLEPMLMDDAESVAQFHLGGRNVFGNGRCARLLAFAAWMRCFPKVVGCLIWV